VGKWTYVDGGTKQVIAIDGEVKLVKLINKNGEVYEGDLVDGYKHGFGTEVFSSGDTYKGVFYKGKRQKGTYTFASGGTSEINNN